MADVRIHLRDTETGEEAWYVYSMDDARVDNVDDPEGFWWTDGNAACDCERARCLYAALGRPAPNIPCGDARVVITEATVNGQSRLAWRDANRDVTAMKAGHHGD